MKIGRRTVMVVGTFFLAAATGHVMQNGSAIAAKLRSAGMFSSRALVTDASLTVASAAPSQTTSGAATAEAEAIARMVPKLPDMPILQPHVLGADTRLAELVGATVSDASRAPSLADREFDTYGQVCSEPSLTVTPLKSAMLGVTFTAPCHADERLQISHAGISFTARTNAQGKYATTIPALAANGEVRVEPDGGPALSAAAVVPDLGAVDRFALASRGQGGLFLTADIAPAESAAVRHLSPESAGLPTLGLGGYLTLLGDATLDRPMLAEIVTTPANRPRGHIEIVARVRADNCGRDILATTFRLQGTVVPAPGAVSFAMPDCSALGDQLVMDVGTMTAAVALASIQK